MSSSLLIGDARGYFIVLSIGSPTYNRHMDVERWPGTIITIPFDHHTISALYYQVSEEEEHLARRPVVLRLHGILGSLLDETQNSLSTFLAGAGYSSLMMNTLLANLGLFFGFGIFDSVIPQIDCACDYLRGMGFKKIVIAGQGLGGCMAIRYAALRNDRSTYPDIMGVVALATPYSLPDTVRRRWEGFGSYPAYEDVYKKAKRVCKPEPGEEAEGDEIVSVNIARGETYLPEHANVYTLKTWWALAGPEAEGTKTFKHIGEIAVPILLAYGTGDAYINRHESENLAEAARRAGNKDVTEIWLDTDHRFTGKNEELGGMIVKWIEERT
jgi:dienelactone hydrolase